MNKFTFMNPKTGETIFEVKGTTVLEIDNLKEGKSERAILLEKEYTFSFDSDITLTRLAFWELKTQSNINDIYPKEIVEKIQYDEKINKGNSHRSLNKTYSGHDGTLVFTIRNYSEIIAYIYKYATIKGVEKVFFGEIKNNPIYLNGYMKDNLTVYFKIKLKEGFSSDYSIDFE